MLNRKKNMQTKDILNVTFLLELPNGRAIGTSQSYALLIQNYLHDRKFSVMFMGLLPLHALHNVFTLLEGRIKYVRHTKAHMETVKN